MLKKFQNVLKENNIKYYIVPTSDDHQSEIVGEYYQLRKYISSFTGSSGTLLIGQNNAYLWTDGRYFIQAKKQLPSSIKLMKIREENYPSLIEFLIENLNEDDILGFNGEVLNASFILNLEEEIDLKYKDIDLNYLWENRPKRSCTHAFIYDIKYCGEDVSSKLNKIREYMKVNNASYHLLSTLDDICYLFNIRGHDIPSSPVILSFALISLDNATLYLQEDAYDNELINYYKQYNVTIKNYDEIYNDLKLLNKPLLVDLDTINFKLYSSIYCEIINTDNPSQYLKAIKNDIEIKNSKIAHLKDGIALTQFMYWIKNTPLVNEDEVSIALKLEEFRKAQNHYIEPSFDTICAYKENGAIIHYKAEKESCLKVCNEGLLMIDSGGQYIEGTTDITRTYVLGEISDNIKRDFTLVLKGFLNLYRLKFPYGITGAQIDTIARAPLWQYHLDYKHGTGHGVGHFLNVHEGPQSFSIYSSNETVIKEGMITSDEPGLYIENSHGIRHENLLLTIKDKDHFLKFESLTLVPFDIDGIDTSLLTYEEIKTLNDYHKDVYNKISPYLSKEESLWLKKITKEIVNA